MGQIRVVLRGLTVQPGDIDTGAGLAPQAGLDSFHTRHALDIVAVHSGDVIAHFDARFLGGRIRIHLGDLGIAGLVDGQLHTNAQQGAVLDVYQVGIGGGSVVPGVLIAGAQQVAGAQAVVEHRLVDIIVIVAAHIAVYFGQLVVHALFFFDAGHGAVKQPHGQQHGNGERNGHGQDDDGDRHPQRDLPIHFRSSTLRPAASAPRSRGPRAGTPLQAANSQRAESACVFLRS